MNTLFFVYLIVEAIFAIGFVLVPGIMLDPFGVTIDETSTTFARLFGSALLSFPVLLLLVRKSTNPEFRRGVVYCMFSYLVGSTIILLITQLNGLMNAKGWGIVCLHLVFMVWFGYYLLNPGKSGNS